jgi:hypothetical protein
MSSQEYLGDLMATPYGKMTPEQKTKAHARTKRWAKKNPDKKAKYREKHYYANKDKYLQIERERSWAKLYGMTPEMYDKMLRSQNGTCQICGSSTPDKGGHFKFFAVDHDHKTGAIRGLLCIKCNSSLGWFEANANRVITYLL